LDGKEVGGKKLFVGRAQKKAERQAELKRKFEMQKMERLNRYQVSSTFIDCPTHSLGQSGEGSDPCQLSSDDIPPLGFSHLVANTSLDHPRHLFETKFVRYV
jgi:hypothetical protein